MSIPKATKVPATIPTMVKNPTVEAALPFFSSDTSAGAKAKQRVFEKIYMIGVEPRCDATEIA